MYVQNRDVTYFDSFGAEHIPKEIKTFIGNKNIKTNIFRIQAYNLIMCGYFYLDLLILCLQESMLAVTDLRNLFHQIALKKQ